MSVELIYTYKIKTEYQQNLAITQSRIIEELNIVIGFTKCRKAAELDNIFSEFIKNLGPKARNGSLNSLMTYQRQAKTQKHSRRVKLNYSETGQIKTFCRKLPTHITAVCVLQVIRENII